MASASFAQSLWCHSKKWPTHLLSPLPLHPHLHRHPHASGAVTMTTEWITWIFTYFQIFLAWQRHSRDSSVCQSQLACLDKNSRQIGWMNIEQRTNPNVFHEALDIFHRVHVFPSETSQHLLDRCARSYTEPKGHGLLTLMIPDFSCFATTRLTFVVSSKTFLTVCKKIKHSHQPQLYLCD